jgi:hypothetical protein
MSTRKRIARSFAMLALAFTAPLGCNQKAGTFVALTFEGKVDTSAPIQMIRIELKLGDRLDNAVFQAPSGSSIALPTTATLEVQQGDGDLTIIARALALDGRVLGLGSGLGHVASGETTQAKVTFGIAQGDGGLSADAQPPSWDATGFDAGNDPRDQAARPTDGSDMGRRDLATTGTGGAPATGGTLGGSGGSGAGGAIGRDAAPDAVVTPDAPGANDGAVGYKLGLKPSIIDFGLWPVGATSTAQTLTVTNLGTAPAPGLTLIGGDRRHFPVDQDRCTGMSLDPGRTCTVTFTFVPDALGSVRSTASIATSDGAALELGLTGIGIDAGTSTLALSPILVDFNEVDVGIASSVTFTVTNNETASTGAIQIQIDGSAGFQIVNNACASMSLGAQGQCTFVLMFAPTTFGVADATIRAQSESGGLASSSATGIGRDRATLAVQFAGSGSGAVSAAGTTCLNGNACSISVVRLDADAIPKLEVTATPNAGSQFAGWSGDCTGTDACVVLMDRNHQITASFTAATGVDISLNVLGLAGHLGSVESSDGTLTCSGNCPNLSHPATDSFTLIAKPKSGSTFAGWSDGPCHGTAPKCTFPLTSSVGITASFGPPNYVFVSSSTVVPGRLGGVKGADDECQRLASSANLPGRYAAWISTTGVDARTRVGSGGWLRTDGRPFAKSLLTLGTGKKQVVYYPPRLDEMGNDLGNGRIYVATGSNQDGSNLGSQCGDYASTVGPLYVGDAAAGSLAWSMTELHDDGCSQPQHLYCLRSDGPSADLMPPAQPGRRAFLSQQPFVIGNGTTPDQLCRAEAGSANLANPASFVAFIATSSTPASKRLLSSGPPWKRFDEVLVARQAADFAKGKLIAPIDLASDGATYLTSQVWTGAADPSTPGTATCDDWTVSLSTTGKAIVGDPATSATPDWFNFGGPIALCSDTTMHLLCIEP